jgi:hypothetical protein
LLNEDLLAGGAAIAAYIGQSERATWHMIYSGELPVIRKGRKIFARKSDLERAFSAAA